MNKKSILIIDDEWAFRECLGLVLRGEGYKVFAAENADAAAIICKNNNFDLVLTDIRMPGTYIGTMLLRLKVANPGQKVIVMSGLIEWNDHLGCFIDLGIKRFLQKPFLMKDLKQAVADELADLEDSPFISLRPACSGTLGN